MILLPEDTIMLSAVGSNNETQEELIFFEKLRNKMENEPAWANDLLLSETDNEDGLYIIRCYDHEFIIGRYVEDSFHEEVHVMSLKEALETSLHLLGLDSDLSLLDWLRRSNFKNIRYNNNFDMQ